MKQKNNNIGWSVDRYTHTYTHTFLEWLSKSGLVKWKLNNKYIFECVHLTMLKGLEQYNSFYFYCCNYVIYGLFVLQKLNCNLKRNVLREIKTDVWIVNERGGDHPNDWNIDCNEANQFIFPCDSSQLFV